MNSPLLTIATVCYNAVNVVGTTIESVLSQTCKDYEYIFIDGKSEDGTIEAINSKKDDFERLGISYHLISEKDHGIYNAMNKAIALAKGEWIIFMNAGDRFYGPQVLEWLKPHCLKTKYDVIYGDTVIWSDGLYKYEEVSSQAEAMPFCHQSCVTRRSVLQRYCFNERYRICADYDFYVRLQKSGACYFYIHKPISIFAANGLSSNNYLKLLQEHNAIDLHYGLITSEKAASIIQTYCAQRTSTPPRTNKEKLKSIIRNIIPKKWILWRQQRQKHKRMLQQGWTQNIPDIH